MSHFQVNGSRDVVACGPTFHNYAPGAGKLALDKEHPLSSFRGSLEKSVVTLSISPDVAEPSTNGAGPPAKLDVLRSTGHHDLTRWQPKTFIVTLTLEESNP
jgi:hypothetical protein